MPRLSRQQRLRYSRGALRRPLLHGAVDVTVQLRGPSSDVSNERRFAWLAVPLRLDAP